MTNCSSPHGQISYKNRIKKKLNIIIRIKNEILKWNNDPSWFRVGGPPNEKSSLENKRDHFKIEPMPKNHGPIWNHLHNLNNPEFGQKKKKEQLLLVHFPVSTIPFPWLCVASLHLKKIKHMQVSQSGGPAIQNPKSNEPTFKSRTL